MSVEEVFMLCANRGFVQLRHSWDERSGVYCDTTAGWCWTVFHVAIPVEVYRSVEARRMVDEVYEDAGLDWPSSSPSSR